MKGREQKAFWTLVYILIGIRCLLAYFVELGNDEAYYVYWGSHLRYSYFDHPFMIGLWTYITTFGGHLKSEFLARLFPILGFLIGTYYLSQAAEQLKKGSKLFVWILASLSIYSSVISGTMVMPDAPLYLFSCIAFYYFNASRKPKLGKTFLLASLFIGLGLISKFQAIFLWVGIGLYAIFHERSWFRQWRFYAGMVISAAFLLPTLVWNYFHDFAQFGFHSGRVEPKSISLKYLPQELVGEVLYHHPLLIVLSLILLVGWFRGRKQYQYVAYFTLPLLMVGWYFALYNPTLPHWNGLSYVILIVPAAMYLNKYYLKWRRALRILLLLQAALLIFLVVEINFGFVTNKISQKQDIAEMGRNNPTMDMYGWRQLADKIQELDLDGDTEIVYQKWFPASHLEFYVKPQLKIGASQIGSLEKLHQFYFEEPKSTAKNIIRFRSSQYPTKLTSLKNYRFSKTDTISIDRRGEACKLIFVDHYFK